MRRRAFPSLPGVLLLGLAACTPDHVGGVAGQDPPTTETDAGGTGAATEDVAPTTSAGQPTETTTGPGTTTTGTSSSGTTDEPPAPPAIVDHDLAPNPLQHPGPIEISVATLHAEGVRMHIDGGPAIELSASGDGDSFTGEIAVYSALDNGKHVASFVAWRDGLESAPLVLEFAVALPKTGSELFWKAEEQPGKGAVVALAVTPAHALIELGSYLVDGQSRCYLRRRGLDGTWGSGDLVELHPGLACAAIDLKVDPAGALHVLVERLESGQPRWWLGKVDVWGAPPSQTSSGPEGHTARALALDGDRLGVCGFYQGPTTRDGAFWLLSPAQTLTFDYRPTKDFPSILHDTPTDCDLRGDELVLTGEVTGKHGMQFAEHTRHFYVRVDMPMDERYWIVADGETSSQSAGLTLARDGEGRTLIGGYSCGDQCAPRGELRMFSSAGELIWQRALHPAIGSVEAVAWHPAGYVLYAATRDTTTASAALFTEAWIPFQSEPLWDHTHPEPLAFQTATALAIGPHGQIYIGGTTAAGYPLVACLAP